MPVNTSSRQGGFKADCTGVLLWNRVANGAVVVATESSRKPESASVVYGISRHAEGRKCGQAISEITDFHAIDASTLYIADGGALLQMDFVTQQTCLACRHCDNLGSAEGFDISPSGSFILVAATKEYKVLRFDLPSFERTEVA